MKIYPHMRLVCDEPEEIATDSTVTEEREMPADHDTDDDQIQLDLPDPPEDERSEDEHPDGAVGHADAPAAKSRKRKSREEDEPDRAIDLPSLEALLFSTHHPLTAGRLAEMLDLATTKPIRDAIKQLNEQYESTARAFRVEQVAGGYQLLTLPQFGELLKKFHQKESDAKLTKAALETLAIIAYKQPILRVDVEAIRGVACGETIRSLMEKHLVKIAGRAEVPGRPILYGTTRRFLELFGLNNLAELPQNEETKALLPPPPQ